MLAAPVAGEVVDAEIVCEDEKDIRTRDFGRVPGGGKIYGEQKTAREQTEKVVAHGGFIPPHGDQLQAEGG